MSQDLKLLVKIEGFLADFSRGMLKPEKKFLGDLIFGILHSRSAFLSEIARALPHEPTAKNVKAIHKRLDRNLGNYDLSLPYERALMGKNSLDGADGVVSGHLPEQERAEPGPAIERANSGITAMATHQSLEFGAGNELDQLRKYGRLGQGLKSSRKQRLVS